MGWAERSSDRSHGTNKALARIQELMVNIKDEAELDVMLDKELPYDALMRGAVRQLLIPFLELKRRATKQPSGPQVEA